MLKIGTVAKAQGIKGELKINLEIESDRIENLTSLCLNNKTFEVESFNSRLNGFFVKLKGVDTRTDAENLRNCDVLVEESQLKSLRNNEFYFEDLIGADVKDHASGEYIGQIVDIDQFGSADVIYIRENNIEYSLPFVDDIFIVFDKQNKTFFVDKEKYNDMKIFD